MAQTLSWVVAVCRATNTNHSFFQKEKEKEKKQKNTQIYAMQRCRVTSLMLASGVAEAYSGILMFKYA